jgi:hypothetical protein
MVRGGLLPQYRYIFENGITVKTKLFPSKEVTLVQLKATFSLQKGCPEKTV